MAKSRPSLLGRLVRFVLTAAVAGALALTVGFKLQKGSWAWQDTPGFQEYCGQWLKITKQVGAQAGEDSGVFATTEDLIERAKRALAGDDTPAPKPAAAKPPVATTPDAPPPVVATQPSLPPGYLEAYKAGYEAYRDGLVHFKESMPHMANEQKELLLAKAKLEAARDQWQKAAAIYDKDEKLGRLQKELNMYLVDVRKRIKPVH